MFFAIDTQTQQWCKASTARRKGEYVCACPDRHKVFLKKGTVKQPHFSHYDGTAGKGQCRGGGESEEHKDAKQRLRDMRGMYSFVTEKCPECGLEVVEKCTDGTVEIEVRSNDKRWWYDCVYKSTSGHHIALEVFHTHATTREKIESTRKAGMQIAEFHALEINKMTPSSTRLYNLQIIKRFCSARCKERRQMRIEVKRMVLVDDEERELMVDRERQERQAELDREEHARRKIAKQAELDREEQARKIAKLDHETSLQLAQKAESDREERERQNVILQREELAPGTIEEAEDAL